MARSTPLLLVSSLALIAALGLVFERTSPTGSVIGSLLAAGLAFAAGVLADQFRVHLWVRQERWKLRRDLYTDLLRSVSELQAIAKELSGPITPSPERTDALNANGHAAHKAMRHALATAAIADPGVHARLLALRDKWDLSAPSEAETRDVVERKAAFDLRFLALTDEQEALRRLFAPLEDKFRLQRAGGEQQMSLAEQETFTQLLRAQHSLLKKQARANAEFRAFVDTFAANNRLKKIEFDKNLAETWEAILTAARSGGLEP